MAARSARRCRWASGKQRLKNLKALGVNAIRTAHNPPAPEFLDLCDRMGFLVMDEFFDCWTVAKNPYDYHLYFNDWSQDGRARHDSARPQSSQHHPLQRRQRNPRHAAGGQGEEDSGRTRRRRARSRSDAAGDAGVVPSERQPRLRRRPGGHARRGRARIIARTKSSPRNAQKPTRKIIGTEQRHDRQTWLWLRDNPSYCRAIFVDRR